jgi:hypothetical protein
MELPFIAHLAITRPTRAAAGRGAFERVRSFVRLSVEAVELERELRRQVLLDEASDDPQLKPEKNTHDLERDGTTPTRTRRRPSQPR